MILLIMTTRETTKRAAGKHVPRRTCIACRTVHDKKDLIRLVCDEDGNVEPDTGGKKAGRGAYLCRSIECWEAGCSRNRLENALKTRFTTENKERLLRWITSYLEGNHIS